MADSYFLFKCDVLQSNTATKVVTLKVVSEDPQDGAKQFDAKWSDTQQVKADWSDPSGRPPANTKAVVAVHGTHCDTKGLTKKWPITSSDRYFLYLCTVKAVTSANIVTLKVDASDPNSAGKQFDASWTDTQQVSRPFSDSIPVPPVGSTLKVAVHATHCASKGLNTASREKRPISLNGTHALVWNKLRTLLQPSEVTVKFASGASLDLLDPALVFLPAVTFDDQGQIQLVLSDAGMAALGLTGLTTDVFVPPSAPPPNAPSRPGEE